MVAETSTPARGVVERGVVPRGIVPRSIVHWVEAARAAAGWRRRTELDDDALCAWPAWALPSQRAQLDARALRAGALRHADALRGCIDGRLLQAASELLGRETLVALLQGEAPRAPQLAALPGIDGLAASWRAAGCALLIASVESPVLRGALCAHLIWPDDGADDVAPTSAQLAWAHGAAPEVAEAAA